MVKLREIALHTGFSVSTVSKALNNSKEISPETCKIVKDMAEELGYVAKKAGKKAEKTIHHFALQI